MVKSWYTSKTVWLGVLQCLAAVGEFLAGLPAGVSAAQMISGILTIVARFLTAEPVTQKAAMKLQAKMAMFRGKHMAG